MPMELVKITDKFKALEPFIRNKRVLDIGCVDARPDGNKKFAKTGLHIFLKERAAELVGVDIDEDGVRQMREEGYNVVVADAENMNLGMQFECIVAGEIIEHLGNPGLFLENMKRHLVKDGCLILTTPNAFGVRNVLRILQNQELKIHEEHTCWFDPKTITQLLRRYSFEVEKIFLYHRRKMYLLRYFHKLKYQIPRFLSFVRPLFSGSMMVIAKLKN
jgi:SAM-dependent methyltransferase